MGKDGERVREKHSTCELEENVREKNGNSNSSIWKTLNEVLKF